MSDNVREFLKAMSESGKDMNGSYWVPKAVELLAEMDRQSPAPIPEQVAPSYWNSQRKMIERAIVGLRDGWATREDADAALAVLGSSYAPTKEPAQEVTQQAAKAKTGEQALLGEILSLAELGVSYGLLADDYCSQIVSKIKDLAPTTSTVSASGALAAPDDVRNEALEEAALAVEDEVPCTCCFSDDEVALAASLAETIRAKKSKSAARIDRAAQAATDKSED